MICKHLFVKRNINPTLNGKNPHIVWICKYCGKLKDSK